MSNKDLDTPLSKISTQKKTEKSAPKYALLESVEARFQLQKEENKQRVKAKQERMEMEVVHSKYLQHYMTDPEELALAGYAADAWAHKHGTVERIVKKEAKKGKLIITPYKKRSSLQSCTAVSSTSLASSAQETTITLLEEKEEEKDFEMQSLSSVLECPVLNCGAEFRSTSELKNHLSNSFHSPCNPCRYLPSGCLPEYPVFYMCPQCEEPYQRQLDCQEHMVLDDHLPVFSPLAVSVFMCPQCLTLFQDTTACHQHVSDCWHVDVAVPFAEDGNHSSKFSAIPRSIPMGQKMAEDFVSRCTAVAVNLKCDTCELQLSGPSEVIEHLKMTCDCHTISSTAATMADVFLEYISRGKSCTECHQILQPETDCLDEVVHSCALGKYGFITDLHCMTFCEFVRRCSFYYSEKAKKSLDEANSLNNSRESSVPCQATVVN